MSFWSRSAFTRLMNLPERRQVRHTRCREGRDERDRPRNNTADHEWINLTIPRLESSSPNTFRRPSYALRCRSAGIDRLPSLGLSLLPVFGAHESLIALTVLPIWIGGLGETERGSGVEWWKLGLDNSLTGSSAWTVARHRASCMPGTMEKYGYDTPTKRHSRRK